MDVTLDTQFGEGAAAKLRKHLGKAATLEEFQEGGARITWENGARLELYYPTPQRFLFASYDGRGFLNRLPRVFGRWCAEVGIAEMELTAGNADSAAAFRRIGFLPARAGGQMRTTPERLREYHEWKHNDGEEPGWHKALSKRLER